MLAVYFVSGWMPPTVIIALVAGLAGGAFLQMTEHLDRIERRLWEGANDQALGVPLIGMSIILVPNQAGCIRHSEGSAAGAFCANPLVR